MWAYCPKALVSACNCIVWFLLNVYVLYIVVLSDIGLGLIESLHVGMTLSGALSIPATLTSTLPLISCVVRVLW
jgi:hypothetical protein